MKRIYEPSAYSNHPIGHCFWMDGAPLAQHPVLVGEHLADVAIIGAGFTGLSAALHLARDGVDVAVVDAEQPSWGATGRNGGFCCLGGSLLSDVQIKRRVGDAGLIAYRHTEVAAVQHVSNLISELDLDVERHSAGETQLAHKPKKFAQMQTEVAHIHKVYGVRPEILAPQDLSAQGFGTVFHGGLTTPIGFGLNPRKLAQGIERAAVLKGARFFGNSPVIKMDQKDVWHLTTPQGTLIAKRVLIATNGYSSEDIPTWMRARYLPVQSSILVTRPMTTAELEAANWTTRQASYDSRLLLHYFRLLPDNRFLFGMRGGLYATRRNEARIKHKIRQDFERMFPAWQTVETPHYWSGLVAFSGSGAPFVGPIPKQENLWAGFGYHGNGVAMANYSGALLADLMQGKTPKYPYPDLIKRPPKKFPFGCLRRNLLLPTYLVAETLDL